MFLITFRNCLQLLPQLFDSRDKLNIWPEEEETGWGVIPGGYFLRHVVWQTTTAGRKRPQPPVAMVTVETRANNGGVFQFRFYSYDHNSCVHLSLTLSVLTLFVSFSVCLFLSVVCLSFSLSLILYDAIKLHKVS